MLKSVRAIKPEKKNSVRNNIVAIVISKNGDRFQNKCTFVLKWNQYYGKYIKKAANIGMGLKIHLNSEEAV